MWSDYGAPVQMHWRLPSRRSTRSSIGPKILLAAGVVVAGVICISGIYPQIIDAEWMQGARTHSPRMPLIAPDAKTTRRSGIVAAIQLPPRRTAMTTGEAAVSTPRPAAPTPKLSELRTSVAAAEVPLPAETAEPLPLAEIPDAGANADAPPKPAWAVAAKPVAPVVKRRVARAERSEHHQRSYSGAFATGGWGGSPFHM
jgi:hypothetical protein